MDKYNWIASESAPLNFPMEIVGGNFLYPDGSSLYIPRGKTLYHGWGNGHSLHVVGPDMKDLPNKLHLKFFSYAENKFYQAEFQLPYNKIRELFSKGYFSPKEQKDITYDQIVAGVAPGGAVSVWVSGIDRTTEIFFSKADKVNLNWKLIVDNPDISRDKFIQIELEDSIGKEGIADLKKNGIPFSVWEKYHKKRYSWTPQFANVTVMDNLIQKVKYFNGEEDYFILPIEGMVEKLDRAVPSELHFIWEREGGQNLVLKLYFDEAEIYSVFEKLGSKGQQLLFEIRRQIVDKQEHFYFILKNQSEEIGLKKTNVKSFGAK